MPIFNTEYKSPKGWTPGANTLAYYKFEGSAVGEIGGTATLGSGSSIGADYAITNASSITCPLTETLNTTDSFTFSIRCYLRKDATAPYNSRLLDDANNANIFGVEISRVDLGQKVLINWSGDYYSAYTGALRGLNTWNNIIITYSGSGTTVYVYINGVKYTYTNGFDKRAAKNFVVLGKQTSGDGSWMYLSEFILEKGKQRTAQEVSKYYNGTKTNYGL